MSIFCEVISACRAPPFWRAVWQHAAFLGVGCRPDLTTRLDPLLFLLLAFPWSSVCPLLFKSATFLAFFACFQVIRRPAAPIEFCRPHAPTGLELDPIHYLEVISCTAQFAFRLTGDPEHATTLSSLQRLVVVACLLTLATGAGVGGWAPKNLFQVLYACRALPFWRAVWRHV